MNTMIAERYEILNRIGIGGMSIVYKAKDHKLNRFVAIKQLKEEFANDPTFLAKFQTEAQAAAGLTHPNIVNVYDVGHENGINYMVMELIEGITLKDYISQKGQISFKEAVSIGIQVARGIEDAHNHNIIHRDIKPQNIMISTDGKVKVTDFGIARAATSETITSDAMGSVHYISPEQARNGYVDARSDIYSLGIVLYEMAAGRVPFEADSPVAVAVKHLQEEMVSPTMYAPDLPISLEGIIRKCTQKKSDRRYQSMDELLTDLKKALISPNENFVVIADAGAINNQETVMMSQDDLDEIRSHTIAEDTDYLSEDTYEEPYEEEEEYDDGEDDDDDEDDGFVSPRMEKAVTIMGVVTAIVIVAIIVFVIGNFTGLFHFGSSSGDAKKDQVQTETEEQVSVPNVVGMTYDEAKTELNDAGLGIHISGHEYSSTVPEGEIISSDPASGTKVDKNTTINVIVSNGEEDGEVPDLIGSTIEDAKTQLSAAGISYQIEYAYSSQYDEGIVMEQSPAGGSTATSGTIVTLTVSRGEETVTVPSVVGYAQADATSTLTSAGLTVGTITSDYSSTVSEGYVISQSVTANKTVTAGTTVDLVISMGEKVSYVTVPSVVGKSYSQAAATLSNYGLNVIQGTTDPNNSYAAGLVYSQYPASGTSVEEGTSITLNISGGPDEPEPESEDTESTP